MKISILISILLCFLAGCNNVAKEDAAKTSVNDTASSPQVANTLFKGEKYFKLDIPPSTGNYRLERQKYFQREEECETLCEKTCGGKCLDFWEVVNRCFEENPQLKRGYGGKVDAEICFDNVPSIINKYPFWFSIFFPQRVASSTQPKTVSPEPKTVSCRVTCN